MKKLKGAVIGAGGIAKNAHALAYEKMTNLVEIVAVCDVLEDRAKALAERLGAKEYFTDYKDVLKIAESQKKF